MSTWELGTRAAIAVLTLGSIAVFAWFLRDALRLFRRRTKQPSDPTRDAGRPTTDD